MTKKVTIELTADQKQAIRSETGAELKSLTFEALENRDAPKASGLNIIGGTGAGDVPLQRLGGISLNDPSVE